METDFEDGKGMWTLVAKSGRTLQSFCRLEWGDTKAWLGMRRWIYENYALFGCASWLCRWKGGWEGIRIDASDGMVMILRSSHLIISQNLRDMVLTKHIQSYHNSIALGTYSSMERVELY